MIPCHLLRVLRNKSIFVSSERVGDEERANAVHGLGGEAVGLGGLPSAADRHLSLIDRQMDR